jgi:hypothetical protein
MYKLKGCALAAIKKKEKLLKSKWVQKKVGEPKAKPDIVHDAILLRRPRSAGPFPRASPRFPKEKGNSKREKSREADTKDKEKNQNYYKKLLSI